MQMDAQTPLALHSPQSGAKVFAPVLLEFSLQLGDPGLQLRDRLSLLLDHLNPLKPQAQSLPGLLRPPPDGDYQTILLIALHSNSIQ